ncbi:hypothetical protein E3U43_020440 [Larimichthys crocea]|uniref:Uncharacterized protein n=1 Tax=Larimichthys crocea TaxID=215358 RepID=A0ACD3QWI3_LARCR|nr:hypothetical protein E3U43_020440 [Larimichthys crocea]
MVFYGYTNVYIECSHRFIIQSQHVQPPVKAAPLHGRRSRKHGGTLPELVAGNTLLNPPKNSSNECLCSQLLRELLVSRGDEGFLSVTQSHMLTSDGKI